MSVQTEINEKLSRAKALGSKASLSKTEVDELNSLVTQIKGLQSVETRTKTLDDFTNTLSRRGGGFTSGKTISLGKAPFGSYALADADEFETATKSWKSGNPEWGYQLGFGTKADVDNAFAEVGSGTVPVGSQGPQYGGVVSPMYYPGIIEPATRTPQLADLFANAATDSNLVRLVKETLTTDNTAATAEGAAYGAIKIEVSPVDFPVRDITGLLPVTEDLLQDIPAAASYISMRVSKFVQLAEENEILNGDASTVHLDGILHQSGTTTQNQAALGINEAVLKLIAAVWDASQMQPEWVAMSPTTWGQWISKRETASGGLGAFLAGAVTDAPLNRMWGLPVTVSSVVPNNKIIIGSSQAGYVFRNGGLRVESSTGYSTFFGEGLIAVRGKVRTAFALIRPQAIGILTTVGS